MMLQTKDHLLSLELSLTQSGQDLRQLISQRSSVGRDHLKLICKGVLIQDEKLLCDQSVKVKKNTSLIGRFDT